MKSTLAFDPVLARPVPVGRADASNVYYADTWLWDSMDWQHGSSQVSPIYRINTGLMQAAGHGQLLLVVGVGTDGDTVTDTWPCDWLGRGQAERRHLGVPVHGRPQWLRRQRRHGNLTVHREGPAPRRRRGSRFPSRCQAQRHGRSCCRATKSGPTRRRGARRNGMGPRGQRREGNTEQWPSLCPYRSCQGVRGSPGILECCCSASAADVSASRRCGMTGRRSRLMRGSRLLWTADYRHPVSVSLLSRSRPHVSTSREDYGRTAQQRPG